MEGFVDYTEPLSDDEDEGEDNRLKGAARNEGDWVGDVGEADLQAAKSYRENHVREEAERAKKPGKAVKRDGATSVKEIFTKLTPANLARLLNSKLDMDRNRPLNSGTSSRPTESNGNGISPVSNEEVQDISGEQVNESGFTLNPGRIEYVSSFRAGPGKRIAIPVRIEPKVFFANERTSALLPFVVLSCVGYHR